MSFEKVISIKADSRGDPPYGDDLHTVKVTAKTLQLISKGFGHGEYEKIVFEKSSSQIFGARLEVKAVDRKLIENGTKTKRCDLGHDHEVPIEKKYEWHSATVRMPWDQVDLFIEWLNKGFWRTQKESQMAKHECGECDHVDYVPKHFCKDGFKR